MTEIPSGSGGVWRLRTSLTVLLLVATLVTYGVIGIAVLAYRVPEILKEESAHVQSQSVMLARYFEQLVDGFEGRLTAFASIDASLDRQQFQRYLDGVVHDGGYAAVYVVDNDGRVKFVALPDQSAVSRNNLIGADFSRNPVFKAAREEGRKIWGDRYLSPLNGDATVALALPLGNAVLIGELSPDFAESVLKVSAQDLTGPILVVDRTGEFVAAKNLEPGERLRNWANDLLPQPPAGAALLREIRFNGERFDTGIAYSPKLNWTFMVGTPVGLGNTRVRLTIGLVLAGFVGSMVLGLILAPLWAAWMNGVVRDLIAQTRALTSGKFGGKVVRGPILEFNQLAADMESMAEAVRQRQQELERSEERLLQSLQNVQQLNLLLEHRVELRTLDLARANRELSEAMERLKLAQSELVQSEKLASLGNLVGGVAHELNTPIGNGVMVVTTMLDQVRSFRRSIDKGIRRSELESFLEGLEHGSVIAERNLQRANELIASFKQVAVDQTSVQRRQFMLDEVIQEILITLQPTLKRCPHVVECNIPPNLEMDSYPGPLGQVLTNLVNNALNHAFPEILAGVIWISAEALGDKEICFEVRDNGVGIPPELLDRVFEPFVTSKLGRGGSGLGLHIVWNTVTSVLGGSITVSSVLREGTTFRIVIPRVAPNSQHAA